MKILRNAATRYWEKLSAKAKERNINLKAFVVLYAVGVAVFYAGVWVLATKSFLFGLSIMAFSYLFDYGYVYVVGRPDRKMNYLVAAYSLVAITTLTLKVGWYAILVVLGLVAVIATARVVAQRRGGR